MKMGSIRLTAVAVGAVVMLALGAHPAASADKCTGAVLKAIGKKERGLLNCQAKVATSSSSVEPACDNKVMGKFTAAYSKAGQCGPGPTVCEGIADDCRDKVRAALPDAGPCEGARLKAAGKKASSKLNCYAKAVQKGVAVDSTCLSKADTKFTAAFNKTSGCTGTEGSIESLVDSKCVAQLLTLDGNNKVTGICPTPATTTTTTNAGSTTTTTTTMPSPACDPCVAGPAKDPMCNSCTALVCDPSQDASCCNPSSSWDALCVSMACTVCGAPCPNTPCASTASCTDGIKNGDETDVDCGGGVCPACAAGKMCVLGGDCMSDVCTSGICQAPTCTDQVKNGNETDIDCGGTDSCPRCAMGQMCFVNSDCVSNVCTSGQCQ